MTRSNQLTTRQAEIYRAICDSFSERGLPPTLQELATKFGFNVNAAKEHVLTLVKKGYVKYTPHISRGIELLQKKPAGIPVYGFVPAGHPFMSQENLAETFVNVENYLTASRDLFGVYVKGDSMIEAEIGTGDLLFVDPKQEPKNGRIVVALVEGEPTVKWFEQDGNTVRLVPANKKYKPIVIDRHDENFKVVGVVVGMIRALDKKRIDEMLKYRKAS
ncbi:MAG: transcriptional repressor LexA [Bacteriovoracaceae bacterium]|nr:transcriptional repressor LexA [Bacteroidota bacterium]